MVQVVRGLGKSYFSSMSNEETMTVDRPHTLGAGDLYSAHLTPYLREAEQTIATRLQSTQEDNTHLMDIIRQQRQEIEKLVGRVDLVVQDLGGAVQVMGKDDAMGLLKKETFEMENAMTLEQ